MGGGLGRLQFRRRSWRRGRTALAYKQAKEEVVEAVRASLHIALDNVGLGATPTPPPVKSDEVEELGDDSDEDDELD